MSSHRSLFHSNGIFLSAQAGRSCYLPAPCLLVRDTQPQGACGACRVHDLEFALVEARADPDGRIGCELAVVDQLDVERALSQPRVETTPHPVAGMDQERVSMLLEHTGQGDAAEQFVVYQRGGRRPQRPAEAEVDLAGIVPRAMMVGLVQPCLAERGGFEAAAGTAVVGLAGIPVAIAAFRCRC